MKYLTACLNFFMAMVALAVITFFLLNLATIVDS